MNCGEFNQSPMQEALMMCTMYTDPTKNLVMFLPDDATDAEILSLCAVSSPAGDSVDSSGIKPTGIIDLYNLHAIYSLSEMTPNSFAIQL
jgi:hypothetical protein